VAFDINISNVIDNVPTIMIPPTTLTFDENISTPIGTLVYDVNTSGTIYDENNVSSFSIISGNEDNKFAISSSGVITLTNLLDWETTKTYSLGIQASNVFWNGSEQNSTIYYINIDINNLIESPPSISGLTTLNIHENIDTGEILDLIQIDSIEEDEQTIDSFNIVSGNSEDKFILSDIQTDSITNLKYVELKIKNKLDFETTPNYILEINATNSFGSTTHTININVIDNVEKDLPLIVIAIEYDDINFTTPLSSVENLIFKEGNIGSKYLKNYFERISKGKFYFKAATPETYDNDTNGIIKVKLPGNHPQNGTTALENDIKEALVAANSFIDFSIFDTKNVDGNISADELQILCIVAGGEKTYGDINRSILAKTGSFDTNITLNGVNVAYTSGGGNYAVVGEFQDSNPQTIGLLSKMLSESTLKFKKQADTYTFSDFDLMGTGYNGIDENEIAGTTPVHPSIYNKALQGWVTPRLMKKSTAYDTVVFNYANNIIAYNTYKIQDSSDENIYYLLEYRDSSPTGTAGNNYDNGLYKINNTPFSGGLRIWKVNNNNGASKIVEPLLINNSNDNIFRPTNSITDLPINNGFSFKDRGTIDSTNKTYSIGIQTK